MGMSLATVREKRVEKGAHFAIQSEYRRKQPFAHVANNTYNLSTIDGQRSWTATNDPRPIRQRVSTPFIERRESSHRCSFGLGRGSGFALTRFWRRVTRTVI